MNVPIAESLKEGDSDFEGWTWRAPSKLAARVPQPDGRWRRPAETSSRCYRRGMSVRDSATLSRLCRPSLFASVVLCAAAAASCAATPPPRWAQGGSPLEIPRARWERPGQIVDIMPDGHVLLNGAHVFSIDRAGRVMDNDNTPIAVLGPEGDLAGADAASLGTVGLHNASPPKKDRAWLSLDGTGEVSRYNDDGEPTPDGKWTGCEPALRACTLTTQVVLLAESRNRGGHMPPVLPGPMVGFGANAGGMLLSP